MKRIVASVTLALVMLSTTGCCRGLFGWAQRCDCSPYTAGYGYVGDCDTGCNGCSTGGVGDSYGGGCSSCQNGGGLPGYSGDPGYDGFVPMTPADSNPALPGPVAPTE